MEPFTEIGLLLTLDMSSVSNRNTVSATQYITGTAGLVVGSQYHASMMMNPSTCNGLLITSISRMFLDLQEILRFFILLSQHRICF